MDITELSDPQSYVYLASAAMFGALSMVVFQNLTGTGKKPTEEDSGSSFELRPSAIPAPKTSFGLFRQSKLAAPDVSKVENKLAY